MSKYYASLGDKIRFHREDQGLTQEELARLLGNYSASAISYFEKGARSPKAEEIFKLAKIFDIPADELLPNEDVVALPEEIIKFRKDKNTKSSFDYEKMRNDLLDGKNIKPLSKKL